MTDQRAIEVAKGRAHLRLWGPSDRTPSDTGRSFALMALVCVSFGVLVGCRPSEDATRKLSAAEQSLAVIRGSELSDYVRQSELPVLVEFGVDYNCSRCQQVRSDVVQLKERIASRVQVVRVDFNSNARLVAELGGTICPTYVLFCDGEPCLTKSFPVSMDLLEVDVLRVAGPTGDAT